MRKDFLRSVLPVIPDNFFLSNVVLTVIAVKQKHKIFWTPITFNPRQKGASFVNWKNIFKIGIRAVNDFRSINKKIRKQA
jgi:hypothetical protein